MVRAVDLQSVIANTTFVSRQQQLALQQAAYAPAVAAQDLMRDEDRKKERVQEGTETDGEHVPIDARRRQALIQRRRRQRRASSGPPPSPTAGRPKRRSREHIIDLEA